MPPVANLALLLTIAGSLGACAGTGERYPSLEVRDAERVQGTFEAPANAATEEASAPQSTLDRVTQLATEARSAHAKFMAAAPLARQAVAAARGAGIADDRWAAAQVALADLDSARSLAAIALGDLDLLYADATLSFTERGQIDAARTEVVALIAEEDRILAELRALAP